MDGSKPQEEEKVSVNNGMEAKVTSHACVCGKSVSGGRAGNCKGCWQDAPQRDLVPGITILLPGGSEVWFCFICMVSCDVINLTPIPDS